jgi:ABC-type transport system involved in multi-copper enzyme maturation permease subunit
VEFPRYLASELNLIVGPVFTREATTAPRRAPFHAIPAIALIALLGLLWTYWQIRTGTIPLVSAGASARFGAEVFAFLAPVVLALATLFSALLTAAAVAQEKDRKTILLLLITRLTNSELVLGKLLASLLVVLTVIAAVLPFFVLLTLLGGISNWQIARFMCVTVMSALAAGSLGSTIALWREKTFQALATTVLAIALWSLLGESIAAGAFGAQIGGVEASSIATALSPWQAVLAATMSDVHRTSSDLQGLEGMRPVLPFLAVSLFAIVLLNGLAIGRVRVWNPSREARASSRETDEPRSEESVASDPEEAARRMAAHRAPGRLRSVWNNPILWRELRTKAYGKKIVIVRVGYLLMVAAAAYALYTLVQADQLYLGRTELIPPAARPLLPLLVVSVLLVNALAVTSLTNERDTKALDLLLVTDLTPKEIIYGKLGGVLYNSKEMILLPLLLMGYVWATRNMSTENMAYVTCGYLVMLGFSAVLGIHCGMTYFNSRQAAAVSIGTLLFLFVGISIGMRMMMVLEGQFEQQFVTFSGFFVGGGFALYGALGWRLKSNAMKVGFGILPFLTFFIITSFMQQHYGSVFLVTATAYGFATAVMLVPAIDEFDVATGRTGERSD